MVIHSVPSPIRRRPLDPSRYPLCHPHCSTSVLFGILVYRSCSRARYMCIMRSLLACQIGCMQNSCCGDVQASAVTQCLLIVHHLPPSAHKRHMRSEHAHHNGNFGKSWLVFCKCFCFSSVNDTMWVGQDAVD